MNAPVRLWAYTAEDERGALKNGVIRALTADDAAKALKTERLAPIALSRQKGARAFHRDKAGLSQADLAQISRRLSDLLRAGLPLAQVLRLSCEQARSSREQEFLNGLYEEVRAGAALADAVRRSPITAPRLFAALVEAGESLGALGAQFESLAVHYEESLKLRREIAGQLVYPIALIVLIFLTLIFMSFLVLPQFEAIFRTADASPPPETAFVLAAGGVVRRYWIAGPLLFLAGLAAAGLATRHYRRAFERALLASPLVGRLVRAREAGTFYRTLATLLQGGMPLARAMPLASATVNLTSLRADLDQAETAVRNGRRLGAALVEIRALPSDCVSFIKIGDETGSLGPMAAQAATLAESQFRSTVKNAASLLAPTLTALMGLLTAGVIAAVMSGVLSLNDAIY